MTGDTHSKTIGYLLWIFGFTGSHRFYYGKPVTGTIWFFTLGLLGIGWLIDLFLIPSMDRQADFRFQTTSGSMSAPSYEPARIALMLGELRLPTIARLWSQFAERSDQEGWPAGRFLAALLEHELAERAKRRTERHRAESHLDPTKTLASFEFAEVPMLSKAHVMALASGDAWLEKGATILIFGPPGVGKSHVGCGIGHALIDAGYRVLYMRTSELVQRLQAARQGLQLPQALAKLDRYDLLILDDISYVRKDQAETSVLFELIAERYERRSLLITANQPFSGWDNVFPDPGMTVAAIDRLVHHSRIFELNKVESYRGKQAARQQKIQRDNDKANRQRQSAKDNDTHPPEPLP